MIETFHQESGILRCMQESFKIFTIRVKEEYEILTLLLLDIVHAFMKNILSRVTDPCKEVNTIISHFLDRPMVREPPVRPARKPSCFCR